MEISSVTENTAGLKQRVDGALQNLSQRKNLAKNMAIIRERRNLRFDELADGNALQQQGQAIKQRALQQLPDLLEQLEQQLLKRGIEVHWAETVAEANQIVLQIAKDNDVKQVVKGKSMVTEEMGLNHFLQQHQIEAWEADFGEFIMQLINQPPSHIVVPAIHMSREEIAALLSKKLNRPYNDDVAKLTQLAREVLREKFQTAQMGISGVNFAVAENGLLALVENEGNGRMVTTVPKVHVAVMGLEKVIPTMSDLPTLLTLLTRSATGQKATSYFNWISAPRPVDEMDGPQKVHVIVLDNGRSRIYSDPVLRQTLQCIRCGACVNICPVYARVGGHSYQSVYMGPIGKILSPQLNGLDKQESLHQASSLCGACEEVCPVNIPIPNLLLRLRQEGNQPNPQAKSTVLGSGNTRSWQEALIWKMWKYVYSYPLLHQLSMAMMRRVGPPVVLFHNKHANWWGMKRDLPLPAKHSLHALLKKRAKRLL